MEALEAIYTRRSVRRYTGEAIDRELLEKVVRAGLYAPSARNNQPWEFLIVTDREKLAALSRIRPYWSMLSGAAACVIVLNCRAGYTSPTIAFSEQDCSAAAENILLAAHGAGLGGVWLGLHPLEEEQQKVRQMFAIAEDIDPFAVLSLGRPAAAVTAEKKIGEGKLHWETYP